MQKCEMNWEDDENNRIVALAVEYAVDAADVILKDVTPTAITFVDPATKAPVRNLRIHTATGARLVRKQWRQRGGVERLEHQLTRSLLANAGA